MHSQRLVSLSPPFLWDPEKEADQGISKSLIKNFNLIFLVSVSLVNGDMVKYTEASKNRNLIPLYCYIFFDHLLLKLAFIFSGPSLLIQEVLRVDMRK